MDHDNGGTELIVKTMMMQVPIHTRQHTRHEKYDIIRDNVFFLFPVRMRII